MRRSAIRTQAVALGILVVASVVGNVSLSASRTHATPAVSPTLVSDQPSPVAVHAPQSVGTIEADDMKIVPALYSWDPDVRFEFYRHVAKWM